MLIFVLHVELVKYLLIRIICRRRQGNHEGEKGKGKGGVDIIRSGVTVLGMITRLGSEPGILVWTTKQPLTFEMLTIIILEGCLSI